MACYQPIEVLIKRMPLREGGLRVRDRQEVGCGHCLGCRSDQARDWMIRILHEARLHEFGWFVTLTYSDERLPQYGSLYPEDLRDFFKSLRRSEPVGSVRYFACGEYGESTERPHYHAVLFGPEFLDKYRTDDGRGNPVWRSSSLECHWRHGLSEFSTVSAGSASYVAGYVRKKVSRKVNADAYTRVVPESGELVELVPEFSRMSLRPAIGRRWIERYWKDVYPRDYVVVEGREYRPPRYYDKWMDVHEPEVMYDVRVKRMEELEERPRAKLEAQAAIHEARVGLFASRSGV